MLNSAVVPLRTDSVKSEIENTLLQSDHFFSGIILLSKESELIYEKIHGNIFCPHPEKDSQFLVGSISKQITAAIILNIADGGLVDIDKPISQYLPALRQAWSNKVHIRHLLNHTSGIVSLEKPLEFDPGTRFNYSPTLSFYLVSQIAENVSGKNFNTLVQTLFDKAQMQQSGLLISRSMQKNKKKYPKLISGFKEQRDNLERVMTVGEEGNTYYKSWAAGGGVISSAYDLIKWNHFLHTTDFLSKKSYLRMTTPSVIRPHPRYGDTGYGFGLQICEQNGDPEFSHSGYIDGYTCTLIYYPVKKLNLIVLENVSLNSNNVRRAFSIHDKIRKIIHDNNRIFI